MIDDFNSKFVIFRRNFVNVGNFYFSADFLTFDQIQQKYLKYSSYHCSVQILTFQAAQNTALSGQASQACSFRAAAGNCPRHRLSPLRTPRATASCGGTPALRDAQGLDKALLLELEPKTCVKTALVFFIRKNTYVSLLYKNK